MLVTLWSILAGLAIGAVIIAIGLLAPGRYLLLKRSVLEDEIAKAERKLAHIKAALADCDEEDAH